MKRIAVVGLGDPERPAEAVGIQVVRALDGQIPSGSTLFEGQDPLTMLEEWDRYDAVILVDGSSAGSVQVFDGRRLPSGLRSGVVTVRGYGVREILDLGLALKVLSPIVRVVGVELPMLDIDPAVQAVLEQIALISHE